MSVRFLHRRVFTLCLGLLALAGAGCHTRSNGTEFSPSVATGRVLGKADVRRLVPRVILGDESYAEVNSQWLPKFYPHFRAELFRLGIVRWDGNFDCNRFADLYTGVAQIVYFREAFHSSMGAQALALGPFWYRRDDGRGTHAIVQVLTEQGLIFIDPQTGIQIELTPTERASAFLQLI